jgi:GH18 family chitinase
LNITSPVIYYIGIITLDVDGVWITASGYSADYYRRGWVGDINDLKVIRTIIDYIGIITLDVDGLWTIASSYTAGYRGARGVRDINDHEVGAT